MELSYEKLEYQDKAVAAVIDTLSGHDDAQNIMIRDPDELDESVKKTLAANNSQYPGNDYLIPFPQFNIEMETGTGKTMVYLKTIMELHRRFHENKFVIVVPSRAIKAGVEDSLEKMRDYLSEVYYTDKYHYFAYNSTKISELSSFEGNGFEIMLTTVQAFNSHTNIINQEYSEGFWGGKPIDQIKNTNPVVIIDEPQSVDGGAAGKRAIRALNPKITLRYSATHKNKNYPLLFEFGPVKAYKGGFVKHIETLGTEVDSDGNIPAVQLMEIANDVTGVLIAKVKAYVVAGEDFVSKIVTLKQNESLAKKTKNSRYDYLGDVNNISKTEGNIEFRNGTKVELNEITGEHEIWLSTQMTAMIKDHLDRELILQKQGIKVLSLIFLDSVENYRIYNKGGIEKGSYAKLFESIYDSVLHSSDKYKKLYDYNVPVSEVHDGYFAKDKATRTRPERYTDTYGDSETDETAYETIMLDKERLLTQFRSEIRETDTKAAKVRFIFSHSALKEGWDNPNIFQILTIVEPKNDLTRRQKIGRGLRISVNQEGKRVYGEHNVVTIYANESFEKFAKGLQDEYDESGQLINQIGPNFFAGTLFKAPSQEQSLEIIETTRSVVDNNIDGEEITNQVSEMESSIFVEVIKKHYVVNSDNTVNHKVVKNLNNKVFAQKILHDFVESGGEIPVGEALIKKVQVEFGSVEATNRKKRDTAHLIDPKNEYFTDLWNKISHKVKYRVSFTEKDLINDILNGDNPINEIKVSKMTTTQIRSRVDLKNSGVEATDIETITSSLVWKNLPIFDVTKLIADKTGLTRRMIINVIKNATIKDESFIEKIKQNPALFVRRAIINIKVHERKLLNKSLVYVQTGEIWPVSNFKSYDGLETSFWKVPTDASVKTLFDKILVQSKEERYFANQLAIEQKVKYFLKLPNWFKIPTPFGNYNPDWAIIAETNGQSRMYFVVDTKTTRETGELRPEERDRLRAGRQAFEVTENVKFDAPVKVIADIDLG